MADLTADLKPIKRISKDGKMARRSMGFWCQFNTWYRTFWEAEGRRPSVSEVKRWYDDTADACWGDVKPTWEETRTHSKCLRSLDQVRSYFRQYRAAKKETADGNTSASGASALTARICAGPRKFNAGRSMSSCGPAASSSDSATPLFDGQPRHDISAASSAAAAAAATVAAQILARHSAAAAGAAGGLLLAQGLTAAALPMPNGALATGAPAAVQPSGRTVSTGGARSYMGQLPAVNAGIAVAAAAAAAAAAAQESALDLPSGAATAGAAPEPAPPTTLSQAAADFRLPCGSSDPPTAPVCPGAPATSAAAMPPLPSADPDQAPAQAQPTWLAHMWLPPATLEAASWQHGMVLPPPSAAGAPAAAPGPAASAQQQPWSTLSHHSQQDRPPHSQIQASCVVEEKGPAPGGHLAGCSLLGSASAVQSSGAGASAGNGASEGLPAGSHLASDTTQQQRAPLAPLQMNAALTAPKRGDYMQQPGASAGVGLPKQGATGGLLGPSHKPRSTAAAAPCSQQPQGSQHQQHAPCDHPTRPPPAKKARLVQPGPVTTGSSSYTMSAHPPSHPPALAVHQGYAPVPDPNMYNHPSYVDPYGYPYGAHDPCMSYCWSVPYPYCYPPAPPPHHHHHHHGHHHYPDMLHSQGSGPPYHTEYPYGSQYGGMAGHGERGRAQSSSADQQQQQQHPQPPPPQQQQRQPAGAAATALQRSGLDSAPGGANAASARPQPPIREAHTGGGGGAAMGVASHATTGSMNRWPSAPVSGAVPRSDPAAINAQEPATATNEGAADHTESLPLPTGPPEVPTAAALSLLQPAPDPRSYPCSYPSTPGTIAGADFNAFLDSFFDSALLEGVIGSGGAGDDNDAARPAEPVTLAAGDDARCAPEQLGQHDGCDGWQQSQHTPAQQQQQPGAANNGTADEPAGASGPIPTTAAVATTSATAYAAQGPSGGQGFEPAAAGKCQDAMSIYFDHQSAPPLAWPPVEAGPFERSDQDAAGAARSAQAGHKGTEGTATADSGPWVSGVLIPCAQQPGGGCGPGSGAAATAPELASSVGGAQTSGDLCSVMSLHCPTSGQGCDLVAAGAAAVAPISPGVCDVTAVLRLSAPVNDNGRAGAVVAAPSKAAAAPGLSPVATSLGGGSGCGLLDLSPYDGGSCRPVPPHAGPSCGGGLTVTTGTPRAAWAIGSSAPSRGLAVGAAGTAANGEKAPFDARARTPAGALAGLVAAGPEHTPPLLADLCGLGAAHDPYLDLNYSLSHELFMGSPLNGLSF